MNQSRKSEILEWYLSQLKNDYVEQTTFVNTCKMYTEKHIYNKKKSYTQKCEEGNFAPLHEFKWEERERIKNALKMNFKMQRQGASSRHSQQDGNRESWWIEGKNKEKRTARFRPTVPRSVLRSVGRLNFLPGPLTETKQNRTGRSN